MNNSKENTIIFLDDDKSTLLLLRGLFKDNSYHIFTTTDPIEALEIIQKEKSIKVIICDQLMPMITGVEFLKKLKATFPNVVRILLTAIDEVKAAEAAINEGEVYRFILKPWNNEDLKCAVKQAIDHYDLYKQSQNYLQATLDKSEEFEALSEKYKKLYEHQKEFTSTISHELRTPLACIKASVDLVLSETSGKLNDNQAKFLNKTKKNVDRLNLLISDIVDLTKLELGKRVLDIVPHQINVIIDEIFEKHRIAADKKGLRLNQEVEENLPMVSFDTERMKQVFNNLLENSIKFTDSGSVSLSCIRQENALNFCIKDTGPGIAKEDQKKIFDKFQQLGDSLTNASGTGLGLAFCKEIIEQHNGEIRVDSELGQGCCIYFSLPL